MIPGRIRFTDGTVGWENDTQLELCCPFYNISMQIYLCLHAVKLKKKSFNKLKSSENVFVRDDNLDTFWLDVTIKTVSWTPLG